MSRRTIPRSDVERAARMYPTIGAAARALGLSRGKYLDLCQQYGVEPRRKDTGRKPRRDPS